MGAIGGHVRTITRHLTDRFWPPPLPPGSPWSAAVPDPRLGLVPLTGEYHRCAGAQSLVVAVHGLGGSIDSGYVRRLTSAAVDRGSSVLRLNLRGADRSGADIYHAGLTADLLCALESPDLAHYKHRTAIGFSLGGHMCLRFAGEHPRAIDAVVAVCAPLDLGAAADFIDSPRRAIYRQHLLRGLREIYGRSASNIEHIVGLEKADTADIKTIRQWDELVVARRFGFKGANDYYASVTALNVLDDIKARLLIVTSDDDPMMPRAAVARERIPASAEQWRLRGGHIGFAPRAGIDSQLVGWTCGDTLRT